MYWLWTIERESRVSSERDQERAQRNTSGANATDKSIERTLRSDRERAKKQRLTREIRFDSKCSREYSQTYLARPFCRVNNQHKRFCVTTYSANIIAENMYAHCDTEGNQYLLLKEIVDWKKDDSATSPADMYVTHGANRHFRKMTKGWQLCVEWKDGTTSWERLADLKESNPIKVAEFAVAHGLQDEPAFML